MSTLLQINVTANSGSTGKITENIGRIVLDNGWRSVNAYGRWANPSNGELIRIGSDFSVKEHGIESRLFDNHGLASRHATKTLILKIKEIKPDIIHLHNIHGYYLNYQILFKYLNTTNIPVVWTLHDCWSFTGHCTHFITAGCEKWKTGCFECPLKGDYPKSFIDRSRRNYRLKKHLFSGNNNLHVIAVSDWLAGLVKESFFKNKDIRIIKNGIDLDLFKPTGSGNRESIRILGVSSVWTKDKGLYDFYQLRKLLYESKYEIVLIGLNKKQISELPEGIIGIERTESVEELVTLYSSATVFVNLTYADTFPTVNLEALACGTPVVTYRTGGSPEAIDEKTGIVVEKSDIDGVKNAILSICEKGKDYYAEACRKRAEEQFDKNKCFEKYIDLYEKLISQR